MTKKEIRKQKRRSLKRRIKKLMYFTNTLSILFTCIIMFIIMNSVIMALTINYITYSSEQIVNIVEEEMLERDVNEITVDVINHLNIISPRERKTNEELFAAENMSELFTIVNDLVRNINPIEYKIISDSRILYDSFPKGSFDRNNTHNENLDAPPPKFNFFTLESTLPIQLNITNKNGQVVGEISTMPNSLLMNIIFFITIVLGLSLLLLTAIASKIITIFVSKIIVQPLNVLNKNMDNLYSTQISKNNFENELSIKKPVYEVSLLMNSTNKIITKFNEINNLICAQNEELEAQNEELASHKSLLENQKDELEAQNIDLEENKNALTSINSAYLNRSLKLQNILNNVGQGFLTINKDLLIEAEYSIICESMIMPDTMVTLTDASIDNTLFLNYDQKSFAKDLLSKIFICDSSQKELFISLLPNEININNRILSIEYKYINNSAFHYEDQLLIVLTCITQTRNLENIMNEERNHLNMLVKVLLNRQECMDVISEYKYFVKENLNNTNKEDYIALLRDIHTYKGTFSQYYMNNIANHLNELEDKLNKNTDTEAIWNSLNTDELIKPLDKDIEIIINYTGEDFFDNDDVYNIKENKLVEIENKLKTLLPSHEYKKALPLIKSIRNKSLKDILSTYCDYTQKLSERLDKNINPFKIEGDDVYIDPNIYQSLTKNIVHIFRNSVDHGIENIDTRIELGKPEIANISCKVNSLDNGFEIVISDDGQGIDIDLLLNSAIQKGIINENDSENMTYEDKLNLIFMDSLSTKENATAISGRGVGLASLKNTIDILGGSINIDTSLNKGTKFTIFIPNKNEPLFNKANLDNMLKNILSITKNIFKSMDIYTEEYEFSKSNIINLKTINSLVSIKGSIDAILILSINSHIGTKMVKNFLLDDIDEESIPLYIEDVLSEITNTILGNSLALFEEDNIYLSIGVPATIINHDAYMKYSESQIFTLKHNKDDEELSINLMLIDSEYDLNNFNIDNDKTYIINTNNLLKQEV